MTTPWGKSTHRSEVAPGIEYHETSSHGGICLSPERLSEMPATLKTPSTFYPAGSPWFEHDLEWCRVVLAFPGVFRDMMVKDAHEFMRAGHPAIYAAFKGENRCGVTSAAN